MVAKKKMIDIDKITSDSMEESSSLPDDKSSASENISNPSGSMDANFAKSFKNSQNQAISEKLEISDGDSESLRINEVENDAEDEPFEDLEPMNSVDEDEDDSASVESFQEKIADEDELDAQNANHVHVKSNDSEIEQEQKE